MKTKIKICEYCKKEHNGDYGSGRFCSPSCARGFSTKSKRKEINEKVSKTWKEKYKTKIKHITYVCESCGKKITSNRKYCTDCYKLYRRLPIYKKLKIYDSSKSFIQMNREALNILNDLYFNKRWSKQMIFETFGLRSNTIYYFFKKHNISLRTISESEKIALLENRVKFNRRKNQYKSGWHTAWDNKKVYYRSSYELKYAKKLDNKKILYEMESKRILYYDTKNKNYKVAIPDFYFPLENKIVEIKSDYTYNEQNMKDKFKAYKERGYVCELILDHKKINI